MKKLRKQDMSWSTSSSDRLQCFDVGGAQKAQRLRIRHSTGVPKQTISMAINILFLQCPSVSFAQHSRSTLQVARLQAIAKYPTRSKNNPTSISRSAPALYAAHCAYFRVCRAAIDVAEEPHVAATTKRESLKIMTMSAWVRLCVGSS